MPLISPPPQALWRKNPQDEIDFLAAARGPDIVAIEQDKSASFILDTASPTPRSSRLHRPLKSLASLAPHPEAEAAAKIFSIGKSENPIAAGAAAVVAVAVAVAFP